LHYNHADGNGNVTALVDSGQAVAASYRYDPFGNTLSSSGTLAATNVYRFSSREVHVGSGMYYYLYRLYDPNLQRWINRDPIQEWGGWNLFTYVCNNPVFKTDPQGEGWRDTCANIAAGIMLLWRTLTGDAPPQLKPPSQERQKQKQLQDKGNRNPDSPKTEPPPEPSQPKPFQLPPGEPPPWWQRIPLPFIIVPIFSDPNYFQDFQGGYA
jgi:RHS repeat-associated protein